MLYILFMPTRSGGMEFFMIGRLFDLRTLLINAVITLIALTLHELAHGWVSGKLGDPTPKREGRMTLNPLAHLDLVGTLLMIFTGFGWAKPVMVNPMYYKDKKKGMALVGIAGPIMNILLAFVGMIIYLGTAIAVLNAGGSMNGAFMSTFSYAMNLFAIRNLSFAVFNLIPIPPLDGSRVISMFLPDSAYYKLMSFERYSFILIIVLSVLGVFDSIIGTGVTMLYNGIVQVIAHAADLIL